jgi:hypothetical protein
VRRLLILNRLFTRCADFRKNQLGTALWLTEAQTGDPFGWSIALAQFGRSSLANCSGGTGRLKKFPWASSQSCAHRNSRSSAVSTP